MSTADRGIRILMVLENNPYPYDQRARCEAETLAEDGYRVTMICPAGPGEPAHEVVKGVEVHRFPPPPQGRGIIGYIGEYGYGTGALVAYTLYYMVRHGFDILHGFGPPDTIFTVAALAKLAGKKFSFDHRDLSPELYISKFGQKKRGSLLYRALVSMERTCCRLADLIIAPNESYRRLDMERHGIPSERFAIVRNGPRVQEFSAVEPDPELRAKAPTIIGYFGHMSTQDGLDYLLRSLHHLRYRMGRSDFFAVLIGPSDYAEELQQTAEHLRLQDHVWFTGRMRLGQPLMRLLSAADIFVEPAPSNPLNDRSTMTKIIEYMSLGKPIVAYDLPENRVSAQEAALYTRPNDDAEFARNIARLMDSPELRAQMGAYGRARVASSLGWQYSAQRLTQAYRALTTAEAGRQTETAGPLNMERAAEAEDAADAEAQRAA